ncbi:hypothetical protein PWT90_07847 [Aphanocladium album]|nr:hypothetical protein PWT90_07847 [Aphanocladium album]
MEDVEMSQPMPADRRTQAMYHLEEARTALRRGPANCDEGLFHATQALRLADDDKKIQALANILSGFCHERQDHYHLAYYARYLDSDDARQTAVAGLTKYLAENRLLIV